MALLTGGQGGDGHKNDELNGGCLGSWLYKQRAEGRTGQLGQLAYISSSATTSYY
jgi:hypothetical protein